MRNLLTTILLLATLTVAAQNYSPCYKEKYAEGVSLYNIGRYSEAKAKFVAAKDCPMPNTTEANAWIGKCDTRIKDEEAARQESEAYNSCTSVSSCNEYLDKYPNGKYVAEVKQKKQELQAEDDVYNGCVSIEKCNEYLKKYPKGRYVSLVTDTKINFLEEDNTYANCTTAEKCDEYLNKYPKGRYVAEVKGKREGLREEEWRKGRDEVVLTVKDAPRPFDRVTMEIVYVEGGTFTMGCTTEQGSDCSEDEKPAHQVTVSDFWIGKTEVTQELWYEVMHTSLRDQSQKAINLYKYSEKQLLSLGVGYNYPMYYVSYMEALDFCERLNGRLRDQLPQGWYFTLPTEAEWEYAARGGKKHSKHKYAGGNNINDVAWYKGNSDGKTHPVDEYKRSNALYLAGISGNVCEWCSDWKDEYNSDPQTDPQGSSSDKYRVYRGGSFIHDARDCQVSRRLGATENYRHFYIGFRVALVRSSLEKPRRPKRK